MKKLSDILSVIAPIQVVGSADVKVDLLTLDSREVIANTLFAALGGVATDGHKFISTAIEKGANAILCEKLPTELNNAVCYIQVKSSSASLGLLASAFFDFPSSKLKLVGVTGTNGKTSVATMLYQAFSNLGHNCGLLSTIKYSIKGVDTISTHTTPNSVRINQLLAEMIEQGCEYAFMEVSSHALRQNRTAGLDFDGAVFTNITHDHLDYHKTFKEYLYTKKLLFDGLKFQK